MPSAVIAPFLLLCCLILLFAEVFLPTGGTLFLTSMACLGASLWVAWTAWGTSFPLLWYGFLTLSLLLPPTVVILAFRLWPYTSLGKKFEPPTEEEVNPYLGEEERLARYIGLSGSTATPLNPSGIVIINHERLDCFSEGLSIEADTEVRVIEIRRNRIIVRPVSWDQPSESPRVEDTTASTDLDFDLPTT